MRELTANELEQVSGALVGGLIGGLPVVGGLMGGGGESSSASAMATEDEGGSVSFLDGLPLLGPLLGSLIAVG